MGGNEVANRCPDASVVGRDLAVAPPAILGIEDSGVRRTQALKRWAMIFRAYGAGLFDPRITSADESV
jgi:hypothetical protein